MPQRPFTLRQPVKGISHPGGLLCLFILSLLLCALSGCSEPALYVVTDEPEATTVRGRQLTDEEVQTLARAEEGARSCLAQNDWDGAAGWYEQQLPILDTHFITQYKLAALYARSGRVDESLAWFERSVDNGYSNVARLDSDPALESLRGEERVVPIYRTARENMLALRAKIRLDPWTGPADQVGSYPDLTALRSHYDHERERLLTLKDVFFPRESLLRQVMNDRLEAAALGRYIGEHAGAADAEEAMVEQLRVYRRYSQPPSFSEVAQARFEEGLRSYAEKYPDGTLSAEVRLLEAEFLFLRGTRNVADSRVDELSEQSDRFRTVLATLIDAHPGEEVAGKSLVWLTHLDCTRRYGQRNLPAALESFDRLERDYFVFDAVRELAERQIFPLWTLSRGVPEFELEDLGGNPLNGERFRDRVLLIHFWSSFSQASKADLADLQLLQEMFGNREFSILGVCLDPEDNRPREELAKWLELNKVTWPQYYDGRGEANELARLCRVGSSPFSILLDRQGQVVDTAHRVRELKPLVEGLLE